MNNQVLFALIRSREKKDDALPESFAREMMDAINGGADINAIAQFSVQHARETALHYAARRGDMAMVNFLLERGADVNAVNEQFGTPVDVIMGTDFNE